MSDKSARILVRVRLVENEVIPVAERGSRRTRRHPRDDPRAEVDEDVRVGVGVRVGAVECQLSTTSLHQATGKDLDGANVAYTTWLRRINADVQSSDISMHSACIKANDQRSYRQTTRQHSIIGARYWSRRLCIATAKRHWSELNSTNWFRRFKGNAKSISTRIRRSTV